MEKVSLANEQRRLSADCQAFVDVTNSFTEEQFKQQPDGKWSVADVMQHLYLSARPVALLMAGPRDVLLQWGKPDAKSGTYEEIALAYQNILAVGVNAPAVMSPRPEDMLVNKDTIVERFMGVYQALVEVIGNWSEHESEGYYIPHPALGKLTVLEMLYFTSIHTQHHLKLLPRF